MTSYDTARIFNALIFNGATRLMTKVMTAGHNS